MPTIIFDELPINKGNREIIRHLNEQLRTNPDLDVPDNYKKVKELDVSI